MSDAAAPQVALYDPRDWYWQADDGRVYSSGRNKVVTAKDKAFAAWKTGGRTPTRWPADDDGAQTDTALQGALTPYGIVYVALDPVPGVTVTSKADLWRRCSEDEAAKIQAALDETSPRLKGLFEAVTQFRSDDANYLTLVDTATSLFGEKRAAELLAPST